MACYYLYVSILLIGPSCQYGCKLILRTYSYRAKAVRIWFIKLIYAGRTYFVSGKFKRKMHTNRCQSSEVVHQYLEFVIDKFSLEHAPSNRCQSSEDRKRFRTCLRVAFDVIDNCYLLANIRRHIVPKLCVEIYLWDLLPAIEFNLIIEFS